MTFFFENNREKAESLITNAVYLQDSAVQIENLTIYGSPWQPWFFDWAFNLKRGPDLAEKWSQIPSNTDILLTHGPPYKIGDKTSRGEHVGCRELLKTVQKLNLKYHCFGHIHEDPGKWEVNGTVFINASTCNLNYRPTNPVWKFSLE